MNLATFNLPRLRRRLLRWFRAHQRDLPWRKNRDPYSIWVSEIMLQQTQVATVIPYFLRFLQAFPSLAALAAASEQEVLRHWEGLGYYRRARSLHRAAQILAAEHGGQFPREVEVVRSLPGIGRYTAGAILSQAFDQRLPIVEANSQRVLCRLLGIREDPTRGATRERLWQAAEALLPTREPGEFNQALMEVGALVCTPAAPQCAVCPLAEFCAARQQGAQDQIPVRLTPPVPVEVQEVAAVVRKKSKVLLAQRPVQGRWAGLWEFPHDVVQPDETHEAAAGRILLALTGLQVQIGSELLTVRHAVTHHRITMVCLEGEHISGEFSSSFYQNSIWLPPAQLAAYPVSAPQRRLARAVAASARQRRLF